MQGKKRLSLTRRGFLKLTGASLLLLALERKLAGRAQAERLVEGGRSVSRTTGKPRLAIPSTCLQCPARCGILGFVEDGRLVKIEGNPKDPNSRGRLCAKGQAGVNHLYNPDRLSYPMRRRKGRGEGAWERLSWEEALGEVASRLGALRQRGRTEEFIFLAGMEGLGGLTGRFLGAFGTPTALEEQAMYQANKRLALELTWGAGQDINHLAHTKYILNFGANPYESHPLYLPLVQRLIEGRMTGAKLVTFDPRLSNTAAHSNEWLPLKPGTDGVVALAMANVIMQSGLEDREFLEKWTNYPPSKLAQHLAQYTPEMAEKISGVRAEDIVRLAQEYARTKPATTLSGDGVSAHLNGTYNERAVALLNAITGNVEVRGGYCLPRTYELEEPEPKPPSLKSASLPTPSSILSMAKGGKQKVTALMTFMANPLYSAPDTQLSTQVLKDEGLIPFYAACDLYLTESAAYADIVLPVATYLESWDVQSMSAYDLVPFVSLMQPVVPPQGESMAFHDVLIALAKRIGGGMERYFNFSSMPEYISAAISKVEGLQKAGGLGYLQANGVWRDPAAQPAYGAHRRGGFKTPSGKFEVHSSGLAERGFSPLPIYQPLPTPKDREGELNLIIFQWNVHTYGRTADCMWLSEIVHDNPAWINPATAKALGIEEGDRIKLTSEVGTIITKAWLTQGLHPGLVAIGACVGQWASGRIARAIPFRSADPSTQLLWWGRHGNGVHPLHIIPVASDPVGGGQAWMDTRVKLSKD